MSARKPTVLMVACDTFLAGIYARKFEREGWDVEVVETVKEGEHRAVLLRPDVLLLETDCTVDVAAEVRRLKALPTLLRTVVVLLAQHATALTIQAALQAGAREYLLVGHFVPAEAVSKIKRLVEV